MAKGKKASNNRKNRNKIETVNSFDADIWNKVFHFFQILKQFL